MIVTLNKLIAMLNTIDTLRSKFEGWISIVGLPFNKWNKETFDTIGSLPVWWIH